MTMTCFAWSHLARGVTRRVCMFTWKVIGPKHNSGDQQYQCHHIHRDHHPSKPPHRKKFYGCDVESAVHWAEFRKIKHILELFGTYEFSSDKKFQHYNPNYISKIKMKPYSAITTKISMSIIRIVMCSIALKIDKKMWWFIINGQTSDDKEEDTAKGG